ncbi:MAG: DUF998 domain-containing protein [Candidatus Thorarchaeota archaeon]|nr:MAG: hypothetical protein DRO73_04475 [Candidatus Thorarchaeota archaeon]RLI61921.1 MAG: hypothetical protein DRO93_02810 [Candidatus Thorarchaeota archaeon]
MDLSLTERPQVLIVGGILTVVLYCVFTFTSWALYPGAYWPTENYLSRLGDFLYSPFGAYFYNAGCILTGLALFPFFLGLRFWQGDDMVGRIVLILGQLLGLCAAVALVMIGVFSEDTGSPHMTASATFFLLNFIVLVLVNVALLANPCFPRWIAVYGIVIDLFSLSLALTIGGPITEWITVFGSLLFVALTSIHTHQYSKAALKREVSANGGVS